jgi:hypothetical protein
MKHDEMFKLVHSKYTESCVCFICKRFIFCCNPRVLFAQLLIFHSSLNTKLIKTVFLQSQICTSH